jgi:hypothetical protein
MMNVKKRSPSGKKLEMLERTTLRTMEEYSIARNEAKNMRRRKKKLF